VHQPVPSAAGGSALVRAAAAAGHGPRVRDLVDGDLPVTVGEDVELILWAADYGATPALSGYVSSGSF
jgi:hypothetical protein